MLKEINDIAINKFASSFNILFILKSTKNYPTISVMALIMSPETFSPVLCKSSI